MQRHSLLFLMLLLLLLNSNALLLLVNMIQDYEATDWETHTKHEMEEREREREILVQEDSMRLTARGIAERQETENCVREEERRGEETAKRVL